MYSIAGETIELAKPVIGTIVPAPANFPIRLNTFIALKNIAKAIKEIETTVSYYGEGTENYELTQLPITVAYQKGEKPTVTVSKPAEELRFDIEEEQTINYEYFKSLLSVSDVEDDVSSKPLYLQKKKISCPIQQTKPPTQKALKQSFKIGELGAIFLTYSPYSLGESVGFINTSFHDSK